MFSFKFTYTGRKEIFAEGINKVIYRIVGIETVVEGEDILTHQFPTSCTLHLYSEDRNYSISNDGLISICVMRDVG